MFPCLGGLDRRTIIHINRKTFHLTTDSRTRGRVEVSSWVWETRKNKLRKRLGQECREVVEYPSLYDHIVQ